MPTQWPSHGVGHSAETPQFSDDDDDDTEPDGLGVEDVVVETMVAKVVGAGVLIFTSATLATVSTFSLREFPVLSGPLFGALGCVDAGGAGVLLVLEGEGLPPDEPPDVDVVEPPPHKSASEVE